MKLVPPQAAGYNSSRGDMSFLVDTNLCSKIPIFTM
jgi:hypothetical protein